MLQLSLPPHCTRLQLAIKYYYKSRAPAAKTHINNITVARGTQHEKLLQQVNVYCHVAKLFLIIAGGGGGHSSKWLMKCHQPFVKLSLAIRSHKTVNLQPHVFGFQLSMNQMFWV